MSGARSEAKASPPPSRPTPCRGEASASTHSVWTQRTATVTRRDSNAFAVSPFVRPNRRTALPLPAALKVRTTVVPTAVDEEGWRARDAAEVGAVDVLRDPRRTGPLAERVGEPLDVEAELLGVVNEILQLELLLVREKPVVHLPERSLVGGG